MILRMYIKYKFLWVQTSIFYKNILYINKEYFLRNFQRTKIMLYIIAGAGSGAGSCAGSGAGSGYGLVKT